MRGKLSERVGRLERRRVYLPIEPLSKQERDEMVRLALASGDVAAALGNESKAERRAVIEAAFRADL